MRNVENAREKIGDRRENDISEAYDHFEKGLTLLGVTAVEDRLQDDVPQTMESLRAAHIKVFVLPLKILKFNPWKEVEKTQNSIYVFFRFFIS